MQNIIFARSFKLASLVLALAALAACRHDSVREGTSEAAVSPQQYDLVVLADKDGQYDLDGATLDVETLRDHIRYRDENGQPVRTILLKRGEKQKITNAQVIGLAGIARDLKTVAFVLDNDDRLKVIKIADDGKK
ncbi:MAG: hypothetical protein QM741_17280 [Rudaea sp.]|uniref:hypothetical protein n=1 Tax=Rudaea sp. TaxID=2136325 RepID=UPI0039E5BFAA